MRNKSLLLSVLLVLVVLLSLFSGCAKPFLVNPYEDIDFDTYKQYKAALHAHTSNSDGSFTVSQLVEDYKRIGFDLLTITDHNWVSYPWSDYGYDSASGIISVSGNELSNEHHIVSLFTDFFDIDGYKKGDAALYQPHGEMPYGYFDEFAILKAASKYDNGRGLFIMAHPGRYTSIDRLQEEGFRWNVDFYAKIYTEYPLLFGMEVFNQLNRYPHDREIYDYVLTELMPSRVVYATGGDDNHGATTGCTINWMLLDQLNEDSFKSALKNGQYFVSGFVDVNPETLTDRYAYVPQITSVSVEDTIISIEGINYTSIEWISCGEVVGSGLQIDTSCLHKYVRAVLTYTDEEGRTVCQTLTQPFTINN